MNEKPIIFSAEMIRAILDGRKTQTRRIIRPQEFSLDGGGHPYIDMGYPPEWDGAGLRRDIQCPYGYTGDRLWVRETWATPGNYDHIKPSELAASHFSSSELAYRATDQYGDVYYKWRPSIFMPRWASRITLDVVNVRVERVQDISEQDAYAEGIDRSPKMPHPRQWFRELWDSINAKRGYGWERNPWVWVITFSPIR